MYFGTIINKCLHVILVLLLTSCVSIPHKRDYIKIAIISNGYILSVDGENIMGHIKNGYLTKNHVIIGYLSNGYILDLNQNCIGYCLNNSIYSLDKDSFNALFNYN